MNIELDYKLQQKIALYTAAEVPNDIISKKLNVSTHTVDELQSDEDFKNLVTSLKKDLDSNKPMLVLRDNDKALDIWVKENTYNLYQAADNFQNYLYGIIEDGVKGSDKDDKKLKGVKGLSGSDNPKGLRDLSAAITGIMEIKRKILSDLGGNHLKSRELDIKEGKHNDYDYTPIDIINNMKEGADEG